MMNKETRQGLQKIGYLVASISRPFFQQKGFMDERIVFYWKEIMGQKWADHSLPLQLISPPQLSSNARTILELLVTPGAALEISFSKSVLIEKINQFFGYRLVHDLRLYHGQILQKSRPKPVKQIRPITQEEEKKIENLTLGITDENLRNALNSLGKAVFSQKL